MKAIAHVYQRVTRLAFAFLLAVTSVSAVLPFLSAPQASALTNTAYTPVSTSGWVTDRTVPSGTYGPTTFDGRDALQIGVDAPSGETSSFYRYEGLQKAVPDGTTSVTADLYIDPSWPNVRVGFWAVGFSSTPHVVGGPSDNRSTYAIIEYNTASSTNWRIWDSVAGSWSEVAVPSEQAGWNTIEIALDQTDSTISNIYVNDTFVGTSAGDPTADYGTIIFNNYNYAQDEITGLGDYDVYWSNIQAGLQYVAKIGTTPYATLPAAIAASVPGDTIEVYGDSTITATQVLNKAGVTIRGIGNVSVSTTGTQQLFTITADDVTIDNLAMVKTDNSSAQNFVGIQADRAVITNNSFTGQFVTPSTGATVRGLVTSSGADDLFISANSFTNLRQPAYLNNGSTGVISANYVTGTRGWVVEKASAFTFLSNTWGANTDGSKTLDIAVIPGSDPASTVNNYTCDIPAIIAANYAAAIEDQYPSTDDCSTVTPTVDIPAGTTVPVTVTVTTDDVEIAFETTGVDTVQATTPELTVVSPSATVTIPAGTVISGEGWNGILTTPTITTVTTVIPTPTGSTTTVDYAIEFGAGDVRLELSQAARIVLPGQAGKSAGSVSGGVFTPISTVCAADDQAVANALPAGGDCVISVGGDLVIWTKHFSQFIAYTTTTPTPTTGGGTTTTPSSNTAATDTTTVALATVDENGDVTTGEEAASTSQDADVEAATDENAGIAWYWWVLIVVALFAIGLGVRQYWLTRHDSQQ